jgi:hypothetical protein
MTYKIQGQARRELKKQLAELKHSVRYFWHFHSLDKDMTSMFGNAGNYPMTDEAAEKRFNTKKDKIKELENQLSELQINS